MAADPGELDALLSAMQPVLHDGVFAFAALPAEVEPGDVEAIATIREREGWTVVVEESEAQRAGLTALFRAAWITLRVNSDLQAVGFTAAFATALAQARIACNVIAGVRHDHVFVPTEKARLAMKCLNAMAGTGFRSSRC